MKQVYANLSYLKQMHSAGLCGIQITPREWLVQDPVIDFESGRVLQAPALKSDKYWLYLQLTPPSYNYEENPKASKSGDYYEVSASGLLNSFNYQFQQILGTLRMHELVTVLTDRNQRRKIIGNSENAMKLAVTHTHNNKPGEEKLSLDFACQCEALPPYYNPDNTPDTIGNFLINSNGDFLLIG